MYLKGGSKNTVRAFLTQILTNITLYGEMCTLTIERNDMRNEENGISSHPYCSDVSRCRVHRRSHSYGGFRGWKFLSMIDIVRDTGVSLLFFCLFCKFDIENEKWYIKNRIEEVSNQAPEYISIAGQVIRKAEPVCCACKTV